MLGGSSLVSASLLVKGICSMVSFIYLASHFHFYSSFLFSEDGSTSHSGLRAKPLYSWAEASWLSLPDPPPSLLELSHASDDKQQGVPSAAIPYTAFQDVSWAVVDNLLSTSEKQDEYNAFMQGCIDATPPEQRHKDYCRRVERERLERNVWQPQAMVNYTEMGFHKVRAPRKLYQLLKAFWDDNRHTAKEELDRPTPYHNSWVAPPTFVDLYSKEKKGGGAPLVAAIAHAAKGVLEEWTGQKLAQSSLYGIRVYHNNSILAPHVDRTPLVTSAIFNVDQDVDQDWVLEVYDHQGLAHNVTMKPGDMVLYESHSVLHGRPYAMKGKFFANVFIHFEPLGPLHDEDNYSEQHPTLAGGTKTSSPPSSYQLHPWIVPGSKWQDLEYNKAYPNGWTLLKDIRGLVKRGDLSTLQYADQRDPKALVRPLDEATNWQPVHLAVEAGHLDILEYMLKEGRVDVNAPYTYHMNDGTDSSLTMTPLDVNFHFGSHTRSDDAIQDDGGDAMFRLLRKYGGLYYGEQQTATSSIHQKTL